MKERAKELKKAGAPGSKADGEQRPARKDRRDVAARPSDGRAAPRTHQGQRARPLAEDLVRDARVRQGRQGRLLLPERTKFKSRYATLGFSDEANLDEGSMWPTSFALKELGAAEEARIGELVRGAVA